MIAPRLPRPQPGWASTLCWTWIGFCRSTGRSRGINPAMRGGAWLAWSLKASCEPRQGQTPRFHSRCDSFVGMQQYVRHTEIRFAVRVLASLPRGLVLAVRFQNWNNVIPTSTDVITWHGIVIPPYSYRVCSGMPARLVRAEGPLLSPSTEQTSRAMTPRVRDRLQSHPRL